MDIETKTSRLEELEAQTAVSGFWNDQENSQKVVQEMSHLKNVLKGYEKLRSTYEDTLTLIELAIEMEDESIYDEAEKSYRLYSGRPGDTEALHPAHRGI